MRSLYRVIFISISTFLFLSNALSQVLDGADQVPGQYLIQFNSHENLNKFHDKLASDRSFIQSKTLGKNSSIVSIYAPDLTYENLKEIVSNLDGVVAFQKDYYLEERSKTPNDPLFNSDQWDMRIIKAPEAWDFTTGGKTPLGHEIVVAVLDNGFYPEHPDLIENLFTNTAEIPGNGIDDDDNGYIDDVHGANLETNNGTHSNATHGAGVMGILGASGNNGMGISGVNWNVKIMPVSRAVANVSALIEGYEYIKEFRKKFNQSHGQEGAFIVASNLSAGISKKFPIDQPIWCNMYDSLGYAGVLSTGATANANTDVDAEGDLPSTCESEFLIVVTNTTQNDVKYGSAGYGSKSVDLGAPGDGCTSTADPIGYASFGGTSCATPHVTGAIALMYAASTCALETTYMDYPVESARAVRNAILNNVDKLPSLNGVTVTGGRLNLLRMITNCVASTSSYNTIKFDIYPNPVQESLTVELGDMLTNNILIQLIDIQGRVVGQTKYLTAEKIIQPVNSLSPGIYCIRVISGRYAGSTKFVKL